MRRFFPVGIRCGRCRDCLDRHCRSSPPAHRAAARDPSPWPAPRRRKYRARSKDRAARRRDRRRAFPARRRRIAYRPMSPSASIDRASTTRFCPTKPTAERLASPETLKELSSTCASADSVSGRLVTIHCFSRAASDALASTWPLKPAASPVSSVPERFEMRMAGTGGFETQFRCLVCPSSRARADKPRQRVAAENGAVAGPGNRQRHAGEKEIFRRDEIARRLHQALHRRLRAFVGQADDRDRRPAS